VRTQYISMAYGKRNNRIVGPAQGANVLSNQKVELKTQALSGALGRGHRMPGLRRTPPIFYSKNLKETSSQVQEPYARSSRGGMSIEKRGVLKMCRL